MEHKYVFEVPPHTNGGESFLIETVTDNYGEIYQRLILNSYSNSCSITLLGNVLTPTVLRILADNLEENFPNRM